MGHGYTTDNGWFIDPLGRRTILRGVNLGGSTKVPRVPDGATRFGADLENWREVSFVGRPFSLDEAARHLDRIRDWGFNVLRLLTTWEAIEHKGPGEYDDEYLSYLTDVARMARDRGLLVFLDPHHDIWSRWTGGDGAPFWCFELAGLRPENFIQAGAVELDAIDWPSMYQRVPVATMWTLFFAAETFLPELAPIQRELQDRYIAAVCAAAERLADLDNVLGYDSFNEPSEGYIGQSSSLNMRMRLFGDGPVPFSALEYLAGADGVSLTHPDDGRVLNPDAISIWRDGCPWRRAGVWDIDETSTPRLATPDYFTSRDGVPVNAWSDFVVPFIRRFRDGVRTAHPGCMVFIEGSPLTFKTPWDDPDRLIVNARHWYELKILLDRNFHVSEYSPIGGGVLSGVEAIGAHMASQLEAQRRVNSELMGNPPMLIGEFGLPFDLNSGEALGTGDYSEQEALLDANYRAMEANLLNSTQWNYTADNTHTDGDQWNHEDFSIFCCDEVAAGTDLESGGRTIDAFVRPYVRHCAGTPIEMTFDLATRRFRLEIEADPAIESPTLLFAPQRHFGDKPAVTVSGGTTSYDPSSQTLEWDHSGSDGSLTIELSRPPGAD